MKLGLDGLVALVEFEHALLLVLDQALDVVVKSYYLLAYILLLLQFSQSAPLTLSPNVASYAAVSLPDERLQQFKHKLGLDLLMKKHLALAPFLVLRVNFGERHVLGELRSKLVQIGLLLVVMD